MKEDTSEDQFHNPPGLHGALTEAVAENDEDLMALEEATLREDLPTGIISHDAYGDTLERDLAIANANLRATMLENQLNLARAKVQKLNRPVTIDDAMPVLELYRQFIRVVRPLSGSERDKWVESRERCLNLQNQFQEKGKQCKYVREQCEELREQCESIRVKCVSSSQYFDRSQEKFNSLFEEDEDEEGEGEDAQELYDMMRGRMGQQEQELEDSLKRTFEMIQKIEDMFIWVVKAEKKLEFHIHQLRRFEGILDDILRSFDYWFGSL